MTAEDHVRRRLADTGAGVDISRKATRRLINDKTPTIVRFADEFIGSGKVEDHIRAVHGKPRRRRAHRPQIFADFNAEDGNTRIKNEVVAKGNSLSAQRDDALRRIKRTREPTGLVELVRTGEEGLRHHAEKSSGRDERRAVVDPPPLTDGKPDSRDRRKARPSMGDEVREGRLGGSQKRGLAKEVSTRVTGQTKFGEYDRLRPRRDGLVINTPDALQIARNITRPHRRHGGGNTNKIRQGVIHDMISFILASFNQQVICKSRARQGKTSFCYKFRNSTI